MVYKLNQDYRAGREIEAKFILCLCQRKEIFFYDRINYDVLEDKPGVEGC